MYDSQSELRRKELQARQRVTVNKGTEMKSIFLAGSIYQSVSLVSTLYIVFGTDSSPVWLFIHPISTIWYLMIMSVYER